MIHYTASGVRLTQRGQRAGELNWLFLAGDTDLGSDSLASLVDALALPGTSWLVDLPGAGTNTDGPGIADDPTRSWHQVLSEAAAAVPAPVYVGHGAGAAFVLQTPRLENLVLGIALLDAQFDTIGERAAGSWATSTPTLVLTGLGEPKNTPAGPPDAVIRAFEAFARSLGRPVPESGPEI